MSATTQRLGGIPGLAVFGHAVAAGLAVTLFWLAGDAADLWVAAKPVIWRTGHDVALFFVVYHDTPWLVLTPAIMAAALLAARRPAVAAAVDQAWRALDGRRGIALLALAVVAGAAAGQSLVMHDFALSMDETLTRFQAAIFSEGAVWGRRVGWWGQYVQPMFQKMAPDGRWMSEHLPVTALLWALAGKLSASWLVNPAAAGLSVALVAAIARRIWPETPGAGTLAALLLASATQLWLPAMTSYAMPQHLVFNLFWLWLHLRGGVAGHGAAPLVGAAAMGLHQSHFHPLFAIPFLLEMWRKPKALAWYLLVYGAAFLFWKNWFGIALWLDGGVAEAVTQGGSHDPVARLIAVVSKGFESFDLMMSAASVLRFAAWQHPLALALAVAALVAPWWRDATLRPLVGGIALTLGASLLFQSDQGHGWGYRYLHGLLGNLVLVAVWAWQRRSSADELRRLAVVLAGVMLFVALPLRAVQAERFVRPYAEADRLIAAQDLDVVVVDWRAGWYSIDLARNDPFGRNRPLRMAIDWLPPRELFRLCSAGKARIMGTRDMVALGIPQFPIPSPLPAQWQPCTGLKGASR